jgi:uncharacterized protein YndB with AHSA1/START domain
MPASGDSATATITGEYEFNAPAEVVFGVLTDPDRTTRWLPAGMRTDSAAPDHVLVRAGSRTYGYDVTVVSDRLRVEWRSRDIPGLHGSAWVRDAPAGGSTTYAEVAVPDGVADRQRAEDLLVEAMGHLQRDVSDNFNAG